MRSAHAKYLCGNDGFPTDDDDDDEVNNKFTFFIDID